MTDHLTDHIRNHISEQEEAQLNSPLLEQLRSDVTRMMEDEMNYYLLKRDDEYQIIYCTTYDPLYGYGSWNLEAGPFNTWEEAEAAAPDEN